MAEALAGSSSALYYETETRTGQLSIDRLNLSGARGITQVVALGDVNLFAIALAGPYVYWSTEAGLKDRGEITRSTVDGSHVRRRFIVPPQEQGGGVADGLASDGRYLYFTRCGDDTIGRAGLNGGHVDLRFISLGRGSAQRASWASTGTGSTSAAARARSRSLPTTPMCTGPGWRDPRQSGLYRTRRRQRDPYRSSLPGRLALSDGTRRALASSRGDRDRDERERDSRDAPSCLKVMSAGPELQRRPGGKGATIDLAHRKTPRPPRHLAHMRRASNRP